MEYKSLKDVYISQTFGRKVPVLRRQSVLKEQPEQTDAVAQTVAQPTAPLSPTDDNAKQSSIKQTKSNNKLPFSLESVHEASWPATSSGVPFYFKNFTRIEGEGNGERKVASLFHPQIPGESNKKYTERLANFIAGQNDSYDVVSDYGNFEVKEFKISTKSGGYKGSVRIGAEGKHTTGMILSQVRDLLTILLQSYASLDDGSKKVLNDNLIQKIQTENEVPNNWTLENYIDAIFDVTIGEERGISEFPKTLFNKSEIKPKLFTKNIKRATFLVYTIPQILTALNQLAAEDRGEANLDSEIGRVQNLQNTLKTIYVKKDDEQFSKIIDREAEMLDRKLISKACLSDKGSNCITINTFLKKLEKENLAEVFANIDKLRQSEVTNLFPPIVKGFFAVFETKYKYIPREQLGSFLFIDSFTQKGLKIALKRENI